MSVYDRWHKSRPKPGEAKCKCRPAKVPTAVHGQGQRWQVRWRDGSGGQPKKNFDTKPEAESFDAKIKTSLDRGDYIDPSAGKVPLSAYARQWRAGQTADPNTLAGVDSRLKTWVYGQSLGEQPMSLLARRPSMIQSWIKAMESAGRQPSTIKLVVDMVGTIFDAAVDDHIVSCNPVKAKSVKVPARPPKKVVPWTLAQVDAMSQALPAWYATVPYFGAGCGHRQGELFGVALEDVDFLGRVVQVNRQVRIVGGELVFAPPKRGKTRTVPLPESVSLRLSAHIAAHPPVEVTLPWKAPGGKPVTAKLLFTTNNGRAIRRNSFNRTWHTALAAAQIPAVRENGCHALRHSAASAWLAAGVDIRTVAQFLGHNDPGFTLRVYTHFIPDSADRARKAMDAFFAPGPMVSSALVVPSG